jgi:hypothetical protein
MRSSGGPGWCGRRPSAAIISMARPSAVIAPIDALRLPRIATAESAATSATSRGDAAAASADASSRSLVARSRARRSASNSLARSIACPHWRPIASRRDSSSSEKRLVERKFTLRTPSSSSPASSGAAAWAPIGRSPPIVASNGYRSSASCALATVTTERSAITSRAMTGVSAGEARPRREQLLVEPACRHPLELGTVGRQERHGRRVGAERPDRGVDERPADVADGERVREPAGQVVQVRETGRFGFGGLTRPSFRRVGDVAFVRGLSVPVGDGSREPRGHGPQDDRDPTSQLAVGDEQDEPGAARERDEDPRQRSRQDPGEDREQEPEAARNASVRALGGPGERDGDGDLHRSPQEQGRREGHGAPAGPTGSHGFGHCTRRPPTGRTLSMWPCVPCGRRSRSTRFPSSADPQG